MLYAGGHTNDDPGLQGVLKSYINTGTAQLKPALEKAVLPAWIAEGNYEGLSGKAIRRFYRQWASLLVKLSPANRQLLRDLRRYSAVEIKQEFGWTTVKGLDPEFYLRTVLSQIADHPISRIEELLPCRHAPKWPPQPDPLSLSIIQPKRLFSWAVMMG